MRAWGSGPGYCKGCGQSLVGLSRNRNALTCSDACRQAVFRDNRETPTDPPLYDIPRALGEMDRYRARGLYDPLAAKSVDVAAKLARHMTRHFPDDQDRRTAGSALLIAAASLGALTDLPIEVVCNVAGLAGRELYRGAPPNGDGAP